MGSRSYKNVLHLRDNQDPVENRKNLIKETLRDSTPLPKPVEYKDIDECFKEWVNKDLSISFENKKLETIALFSNQRFSEYMQSWMNTDENKNMQPNFKVITRENNPQKGTMHNNYSNVVGDYSILIDRRFMEDHNNRPYILEYRMRQPFCIDFKYKVTLVTNKYELLNKFNKKIQKKFQCIDYYLYPNGYAMPLKLESVSDDSQYNINERQFFSQSFTFTLMGFIIEEDDIFSEEKPVLKFSCFNGDIKKNSSIVEIEEEDTQSKLSITMLKGQESVNFKINMDLTILSCNIDNLRAFKLRVNDVDIENMSSFTIKNGDNIEIYKAKKIKQDLNAHIVFVCS